MFYLLDPFGWYNGTSVFKTPRSVQVAPVNTSMTTTPGAMLSNWNGSAWVDLAYVAPPVVDQLAQDKINMIKLVNAEAARRLVGGFKVGSNWYQSDAISRTMYLAFKSMGAGLSPVSWVTLDGLGIDIGQTIAANIVSAMVTNDSAIVSRQSVLNSAILLASDLSTINVYSGWPVIFGE